MTKKMAIFTLGFFLNTLLAEASGVFNFIVNNLSSGGHMCGSVSREHYRQFSHRYSKMPESLKKKQHQLTGQGLFEDHLHHGSVELYQDKTLCLADYSQEILASRDALKEIRQVSTLVWLNQRKAQLILRQCTLIRAEISKMMINHTGTITRYNSSDYKVENLMKRNPLIQKDFFSDCMNQETVANLYSLVAFTERSLPFLSSKELLKLVEAHRSVVVSKKTNQALSDDELLHLDLRASSAPLRFDRNRVPLLERDIASYILKKKTERQRFQGRLRASEFESGLFQELYDDGTVDEFIQSVGLSPQVLKADPDLNRMLACTRAKYDTSFIGSTLDFMAVFAITRSGLNNLKFFKSLPRLAQESLAATLASSGPIIRACVKNYSAPDRLRGSSLDAWGGPDKSKLTAGLDIDLFNLASIPIDSITSCKFHQYDHLFLEKSFASSCIEEALYATLPATLGLGMLATTVLGE
jgi:hypothetical protein